MKKTKKTQQNNDVNASAKGYGDSMRAKLIARSSSKRTVKKAVKKK